MKFEYDEDERLLAEGVHKYLHKHYEFEAYRVFLSSPAGFSEHAWAAFAEMGVLGLTVPERFGGFGRGAVSLSAVMQRIGESLSLEPLLSTVVGAKLIARGACPSQQERLLPAVAEGRLRLAFAYLEVGTRYELTQVASRAERSGEGWLLHGTKRVVLDAPSAGALIVAARTSGVPAEPGGMSLFIVDLASPGVVLKPYRTLDGRRAADVVLDAVFVPVDALVGGAGAAFELMDEAVDFATALCCAEAVGVIDDANAATLGYLKTRKQFGVLIGSFQVLQHRMVDNFIAAEQARSMASLACASVDAATSVRERARAVSAAALLVAQACRTVSQQSVQMHGGIGLAEEMKISHSFRRLTRLAQQHGDEDYHLERFAASSEHVEDSVRVQRSNDARSSLLA